MIQAPGMGVVRLVVAGGVAGGGVAGEDMPEASGCVRVFYAIPVPLYSLPRSAW
jgi:hypothetical protein